MPVVSEISDICTKAYSDLGDRSKEVEYFSGVLSQVDPETEFGESLKNLMASLEIETIAPENADKLMDALIENGYNALLVYRNEKPIGHIGFQLKGEVYHTFAIEIHDENKFAPGIALCTDFLNYIRSDVEVELVLGSGKNPVTQALYTILKGRPERWNIRDLGDYRIGVLAAKHS